MDYRRKCHVCGYKLDGTSRVKWRSRMHDPGTLKHRKDTEVKDIDELWVLWKRESREIMERQMGVREFLVV